MKFLGVPSSGSIAGTTSSHNRAGQYTRNRRAPVQPIGTGRRATVRANFASCASGYAALSLVNQAAWDSFAALHPITDALGQTITLTGQQMFVRIGATLLNIQQPLPSTPPATAAPPVLSPVVPAFSIASGISIGFTAGALGQTVAVAMSQPLSAARKFWKTFWQPIGSPGFIDASLGPYLAVTGIYAAQFGTPAIGQRVFFRLTPIDIGGFNGTPTIAIATVTA